MEIKSNYIPHNFRNKYLKNVGGSYSSTVLQPTVSGEAGTKVVVIDDLETSSKDKALSANMGKYLNENKQDKNEYVDTINQYLSTDSDVKFNSVAGKNGEFDNPRLFNFAIKSDILNILNIKKNIFAYSECFIKSNISFLYY